MKLTLLIVFTLALAMGVQCGVITIANHWGHGLGAWHGHEDDGQWHGDWHDGHHGDWDGDWHGDDGQWHGDWHGDHHGDWHDDHHGDWHGDWHGDDGQWHGDWHDGHHHAAIIVDAHHAHVPHHEGHYVAETRGAVHKAPLAGHIASAAAINVAPAPGTV